MKRRIVIVLMVLAMVLVAVSSVAAKDPKSIVKFTYTEDGVEYICEGIFLKTGSGIVHEWRDNPECINWNAPITNFHLVFKPTDKFDNDDWEQDGLMGCFPGEWVLSDAYVNQTGDEADLEDFFTADSYWSCVYVWD